ncbi:MAG: carbon-nitrogen hydrolase family protein [Proteobacteria bacterium]|nr:MAG: carbon-nitrogen hydrolase family protein [Pseudomonadota bacterium]
MLTTFSVVSGLALAAISVGSVQVAQASSDSVRPIREVFEPAGNYPVDRHFKVAVIQWNPSEDANITATPADARAYKLRNLRAMEVRVRAAARKGAELIVHSEFAVTGYPDIPELASADDNFRNRDDIAPFVENLDGMSFQYFAPIARELGVFIQLGLATVHPGSDIFYNSAIVIDPNGELVATYHKQNLFAHEGDFVEAGHEPATFETPAGKFGVMICADIYSHEVREQYKRLGVTAVTLSASWAAHNSGMDAFKEGAQAMGVYVLAANQTYFPDSGVVSPQGHAQSHIRQTRDGIAYGYLPRK